MSPDVWASVLNQRVWVLSQNETGILYQVFSSNVSSSSAEEGATNESELRDYFQLDSCQLAELYPKWRQVDPHFDACCDRFRGVRTLRQDPVENLFSFICSSNNNISRIRCGRIMIGSCNLMWGRSILNKGLLICFNFYLSTIKALWWKISAFTSARILGWLLRERRAKFSLASLQSQGEKLLRGPIRTESIL